MVKSLCMITYGTIIHKDDQWLLNDKFGHLVDQLAHHFDAVFFIAAAQAKESTMDESSGSQSAYTYSLQALNVCVVPVAMSDSQTRPIWKSIAWLKRLPPFFVYIKKSDFAYITLPGFSGILAHVLCRILRKPYCLYFGSDWQEVAAFWSNWHGPASMFYRPYVWFSRWAEKTAVQHSAFTVVHGRKLLDKFSGSDVPIVETVPLVSVTPEHFCYREDTCQGPVIDCLYVGTFTRRKGVHYLLEALPQLYSAGHKIRLKLVGTGDNEYTAVLKQEAKELNLESHIEFIGFVSDLDELLEQYRHADIFVLPSQGEGFPRVIYEAMSQGLPVVTTAIDTIKSVLEQQELAVLVTPGSPEALAEAIDRVILQPELRHRLIQNGYAFANRKLGQGKTAAQLVDLIDTHGPKMQATSVGGNGKSE